ncbi:restriction endonuclease [Oceanobacillus sp. FSL K6-3682]|uniref:restriction endonuclease n=1 Tax=Oceanobacillus sp. FSL K6-3682 TaxID=2921503 RepID=UPI0030DD8371
MYRIEIKHEGLNKYREIKGKDFHVVQQKAVMQELDWKEKWRKKQEIEAKRAEREKVALEKEEKKSLAIQLTVESAEQLEVIDSTLTYTLKVDDKINWEDLKDISEYDVMEPIKPHVIEVSKEPRESHLLYQPKFNILDKMFSSLKEKKIEKMKELFQSDYKKWEDEKKEIELKNKERMEKYEELMHGWEKERKEFLTQQKEKNDAIDLEKEMYFKKVPATIVDYCDMVLSNSVYPDTFPQEFDIEFNNETKILIVDYVLPTPNDVPNLKEVKYIQSRDEFKEMYLSQAVFNKMYDKLLYQITLRSIHELYEADEVDAIESIVFNGWVNSIDKATGKDISACILSVQAMKSEFMEFDLSKVDPKMCFKNLKGVGSSKLSSLSPIAPIIKLDRNDPRFVSVYDIADTLDDTENLAAMDWQDFEHLIRELFEKEFNQSGGEVKITRASRDGGVDAVAFDPDPIRGGKIVIQAKRYTNVVGVSAVRDLYGTVLNEGATKGILVSTADYGPDAYEFSKGKPLTLLNGNNLLHLLQKHGHRAKIDLKEAKQILSDKA